MNIREVLPRDSDAWLGMRSTLWPHCTTERHVSEMRDYPERSLCDIHCPGDGRRALRICRGVAAFIRTGLHVASSRLPRGRLRLARFRRRGVGRRLVAAVEHWA